MKIGVPRETKEGERRVILGPREVGALVAEGHEVRVERGAGGGIGVPDGAYAGAGARLVAPEAAWTADLVVKVKEVQPPEIDRVTEGPLLFGFQHLAGEPEMTRSLAARRASAIAFELVRDARGRFPLLAPMSEIAGRMAIERAETLLGRAPSRVLVLGAGHAGLAAAEAAIARGARVAILTRSAASRDAARTRLGPSVHCGIASAAEIERHAVEADVVVGAVFIPGTRTPKLLPRPLVKRMRRGAVIADVSIDAGGVAETSRPTTHAEPTFVAEGVIHDCVPNLPAADPVASAAALAQAILPYVRTLASRGIERALETDAELRSGLLLWHGAVSHR
ncbi:MAG TPA: alanine dehydrogenase, partial [Usitatibacter sp.]|nr:alanine dehydrogenase [Usitatibacter sp.]